MKRNYLNIGDKVIMKDGRTLTVKSLEYDCFVSKEEIGYIPKKEISEIKDDTITPIEINPCPFCGAKCNIKKWDEDDITCRVECPNGHTLDWWHLTEERAIKVWNQRCPLPDDHETGRRPCDCPESARMHMPDNEPDECTLCGKKFI